MISLNLTTGTSRALTDAEFAAFGTPLFIVAAGVVLEVVFWSPPANQWIYLVREATRRQFAADSREITVDEVAAWSAPR